VEEVISKIANLFRKISIKSLTMDDIAQNLGISKKTLYQYFENKEDLVNKVAQFSLKKENTEVEQIFNQNNSVIEQLYSISKYTIYKNFSINPSVLFCIKKYYPEVWERFVKQRNEFVLKLINENLTKGIKQEIYCKDLKTEIISQLFLCNILNFREYDFIDNFKYAEKIFLHEIIVYNIRAIVTQKGIKMLDKLKA